MHTIRVGDDGEVVEEIRGVRRANELILDEPRKPAGGDSDAVSLGGPSFDATDAAVALAPLGGAAAAAENGSAGENNKTHGEEEMSGAAAKLL